MCYVISMACIAWGELNWNDPATPVLGTIPFGPLDHKPDRIWMCPSLQTLRAVKCDGLPVCLQRQILYLVKISFRLPELVWVPFGKCNIYITTDYLYNHSKLYYFFTLQDNSNMFLISVRGILIRAVFERSINISSIPVNGKI